MTSGRIRILHSSFGACKRRFGSRSDFKPPGRTWLRNRLSSSSRHRAVASWLHSASAVAAGRAASRSSFTFLRSGRSEMERCAGSSTSAIATTPSKPRGSRSRRCRRRTSRSCAQPRSSRPRTVGSIANAPIDLPVGRGLRPAARARRDGSRPPTAPRRNPGRPAAASRSAASGPPNTGTPARDRRGAGHRDPRRSDASVFPLGCSCDQFRVRGRACLWTGVQSLAPPPVRKGLDARSASRSRGFQSP